MKVIGTMRLLDGTRGAVRCEDVYGPDIDDLWEACTNPERLARWIANVSGDVRVGGTVLTQLRGLTARSMFHPAAGGGRHGAAHTCRV